MVQGVAAFRKRMREVPEAVRSEVRRQLEKEATKVVAAMKILAPHDEGHLRASIGWTWGEPPRGSVALGSAAPSAPPPAGDGAARGTRITIYAGGGKAFYARFQEFGTVRMPANPFFFPAWRAERSRVRAALRRAVKRGFAKA